MGVFNYIIGSHKTPCCQSKQSGWQSKAAKIKSKSGKIYYIESLMQKLNIKDLHTAEMIQLVTDATVSLSTISKTAD